MVFNEEGEVSKKEKEMVLVNPVVTSVSEGKDSREEGCLSFPMINGRI
jgi:peptide deformylase